VVNTIDFLPFATATSPQDANQMSPITLPCMKVKFGKKVLDVAEEGTMKLTLETKGPRYAKLRLQRPLTHYHLQSHFDINWEDFPDHRHLGGIGNNVIQGAFHLATSWHCSLSLFPQATSEHLFTDNFMLTMNIKFCRPLSTFHKRFWRNSDGDLEWLLVENSFGLIASRITPCSIWHPI
jgi:hypothetical protein